MAFLLGPWKSVQQAQELQRIVHAPPRRLVARMAAGIPPDGLTLLGSDAPPNPLAEKLLLPGRPGAIDGVAHHEQHGRKLVAMETWQGILLVIAPAIVEGH